MLILIQTNNNLSNTVKISPALIKNAIIARGNTAYRLFDLSVTLSDETIAYLNVEKDTVRATTKKDGTWTDLYTLATKDDLTKSIDFRGNAKTFKVRSGTDGLKNIYLDIEDGSGNTCSLAFLSDGENAVKLMLNGKTSL